MDNAKVPGRADQRLIDHAREHGFVVTGKQLSGWRRHGLLPANAHGGGLGRGRGSTSQPVAASFDLVIGLARLSGRGKRPADLALLLFGEGLPVPEPTARAAFQAAVDRVCLPGGGDPGGDAEAHLDAVDSYIDHGGQAVVMLPARARRVDEQIVAFFESAGVPWPPAELAQWDENLGAEGMTPQGASLLAADALLTGSTPLSSLGALLRGMSPGLEVNPIASLVETTVRDVPHSPVLGPDDSLGMLTGDVRSVLRELAATAATEDLGAAWRTARAVRAWALDLCARAEKELAARAPGEATMEWWISRQLPAGLSLLDELRTRNERATATALSALGLLLQREQFAEIDRVQPGCQWDLAQTPGFLPPPARDFLALPSTAPAL
ncbi:hypothetical protein OG345_42500 [Streptomyces sp. NBC_01220]|uniref:hypothetical protein n=1 Tax=Streptomyces sp. NBC_01220 TaxID=2903781 RepID=UPI00352F70A9|nr:hypothetical protein OG345_42500 [Streptomyces sp. NBC_01220]